MISPECEHYLLETDHNQYMASINTDLMQINLSWPLTDNKESIQELIQSLDKNFQTINFECLPTRIMPLPRKFSATYLSLQYQLVQRPSSTEYYDHKLLKFKNKGLEFRLVGEDGIAQINRIATVWYMQKVRSLEKSGSEPETVSDEMTMLNMNAQDFNEWDLKNPHANLFGAFYDDQLVALTVTYGNKHHQKFKFRYALRVNGSSPQEYLDYQVCKHLLEQGVTTFERGSISEPIFTSLENYKEKFGKLGMIECINLIGARSIC